MTEPSATAPRSTSPLAIGAIVTAVPLPLVGIVLGIIARAQVRRTGRAGAGLASTAIIVGIVLTVLALAAMGLALGVLITTGKLVGVHW